MTPYILKNGTAQRRNPGMFSRLKNLQIPYMKINMGTFYIKITKGNFARGAAEGDLHIICTACIKSEL